MRIHISLENKKLKVSEENEFSVRPALDENGIPLRNTETDRQGIGTRRIVQIAEQYGGTAGFEVGETRFSVRVIVHCEEMTEKEP